MNTYRRFAGLVATVAATALLLIPRPAHAISRVDLGTFNASSYRAWITFQNDIKTRNLDWGYVNANSFRKWSSGTYLTGSYYYVRFEFKDKDDRTICDTRARLFVPYTTASEGPTAHGFYKDGHCWIDVYDQKFPY